MGIAWQSLGQAAVVRANMEWGEQKERPECAAAVVEMVMTGLLLLYCDQPETRRSTDDNCAVAYNEISNVRSPKEALFLHGVSVEMPLHSTSCASLSDLLPSSTLLFPVFCL